VTGRVTGEGKSKKVKEEKERVSLAFCFGEWMVNHPSEQVKAR
jgi:hypothetical protein